MHVRNRNRRASFLAKFGWAQRTFSGPFKSDALSSASSTATKAASSEASPEKTVASSVKVSGPFLSPCEYDITQPTDVEIVPLSVLAQVARHTYTPRLCQTTTTGGGSRGSGGGKLAAFVRDELSLVLEVHCATS